MVQHSSRSRFLETKLLPLVVVHVEEAVEDGVVLLEGVVRDEHRLGRRVGVELGGQSHVVLNHEAVNGELLELRGLQC